MASWNIPALINKISEDVPAIKALLTALFKWTDAGTEDVPEEAKRLQSVTGGRQIQEYSGSSWGSVGKLMHDVDLLDGKHASTAQTPDTIPVRDANGSIPGNITGNAATATTAASVSSEYVVPIANGGTGATSAAGARTNLGTDNAENITQGVLATARGGTGRNDGKVTDVFLEDYQTGAVGLGQLGQAVAKNAVDCDTLTKQGRYYCTSCTVALHYPFTDTCFVEVLHGNNDVVQIARTTDARKIFTRSSYDNGASWHGWVPESYNKSDGTSIYIAKNGSDAYSGLSADAPVLTWDRAREVARGLKTSHDIYYRFGAGEWGTIESYGSETQNHYTYITNYSFSQKNTKSDFDALSDVPHFTRINLFSGNFRISNINVDSLNAKRSEITFYGYNKFHTTYTVLCLFIVGKSYTISHVSGDTSPVFDIENTNFFHESIVGTFENGCQNTKFLQVRKGCSIDVVSGASWSGTFSGKKADFWCIQNIIGLHPDNYPGTGYFGHHFIYGGNIVASGYIILQGNSPNFQTRHTGLTKGTAPSSAVWYQHGFGDKNGTFFCGVEHGYATDRTNRINLIAYPGTTTDNGTNAQISVGYDANGNWFTFAPKPAANDSSGKIANTQWVREATGNTNLNAATATKSNTADTPGAGDNSTRTATTAWVRTATGNTSLNAASATKLATARSLWGNSFNGTQNVTGSMAINNSSLTKGTAPSGTNYIYINLCDKNGGSFAPNALGQLETRVEENNSVHTYIRALKNAVNSTACCEIACVYDTANNRAYTSTVTPAANSNTTEIATTAWVRGRLSNTEFCMVPNSEPDYRVPGTTYTAATNGFFKVEYNDNHGNYDARVRINGHLTAMHCGQYGSGGQHSGGACFFPVKKGWTYVASGNCSWCGFQSC